MAYNIKYPMRRKMATVLKRVLRANFLVDTGTLVDSVRINAEISDRLALDDAGIYAEIWGDYTEYLLTKYPILEIDNILERSGDILFSFEPLFGEFYGELDY
jgi:hypothetical protein